MESKYLNSKNDRPPIPEPMKREIRRRCGFGCVICGYPLYDYHHIKGWANVHEHVAEDITLLCDNHHRQADGLLPTYEIIEANRNPHNLKQGQSSQHKLYFRGKHCHFVLGNVGFANPPGNQLTVLSVDGHTLLGFTIEDEHLLLTLNLYDWSNNLILKIINNQLCYSVTPWDITFIGRTLTIREKTRKFLIEIEFTPPYAVLITKGRFIYNGAEILITKEGISALNERIDIGCVSISNFSTLLNIGKPLKQGNTLILCNGERRTEDSQESLAWIETFRDEL